MSTRRVWTGATISALLLACGCGDASPPTVEVSCTVTMNGTPLSAGSITFESPDHTAAPVMTAVQDGRYATRLPPGSRRVLVNSPRPTGRTRPNMPPGYVDQEEAVAAEYNTRSQLKAEVRPDAPASLDFEVKSRQLKSRR